MDTLFEMQLSKEDNLLKRFEEIHDYIYANDGLSPQQTLEEIIKVLFIKIFDESQNQKKFLISSAEWEQIKRGISTTSFLDRIKDIFEKTKKQYQDIFEQDERIKLSQNTLAFIVNKLQGISLLESSQDAQGLAFQKFLSHYEKDGLGQFFTPEPVIDFCVSLINPQPSETILDPACGSSGFLMSALNYLQVNNKNLDISKIISQNLFGFDISKSIVRIAKMKLLLKANINNNIFHLNSLEEDSDCIKQKFKQKDGFDIILTNPPFGAKITKSSLLSTFDLGHKWSSHNNTYFKTKIICSNQNADILFVERCIQLLKEGGRMGIVLPDGNLENPSLDYLRFYIKQKAKILAIIKLSHETFVPYGTGVKTSLLFLEKNSKNQDKQYPIFFGRVTKLGYQGNKNGNPLYVRDKYGQIVKDKNGKSILDEDFSVISDAYKKFQKGEKIETDNAFSINSNELNGRFDFAFYSPQNRNFFSRLSNFEKVRLGEFCDIVRVKSDKLKYSNIRVEYIELSDINTYFYEIINSTTYQVHELPSRASYELKKGDIITAVAGNSVGTKKHATALVTEAFEGSICTNGFRVLRNFKINSYYLLYYLRSDIFLKQMYMYRTGAAIPSVSDTDFANIIVYLPGEEKIAEISNKMMKAFELRNLSKQQIESINLEWK